MKQWIVIHAKTSEVIPGTNGNKREESIDYFLDLKPIDFENQTEYICIKVSLVEDKKNENL